jgi:hypothetical protein
MESALGKTPATVKTFRVRGMKRCMQVVEGLIGHRQWFTFRPLIHPTQPNDEYEFDFNPETPESGYSFEPTRDVDTYDANPDEYGLEVSPVGGWPLRTAGPSDHASKPS